MIITDITITNENKESINIFGGQFRALTLDSFTSTISYETLNTQFFSYHDDTATFKPINYKFKFVNEGGELKNFNKFIRKKDELFKIEFKLGDDSYFYFFKFAGDTINVMNNLTHVEYQIDIIRVSYFFKEVPFSFEFDPGSGEPAQTYPLTYPFVHSGGTPSVEDLKFDLINNGDHPSPYVIIINGASINPKLGINAYLGVAPGQTTNGFEYNFTIPNLGRLVHNTFSPLRETNFYSKTSDVTNVDQQRSLEYSSFAPIPVGKNKIYISNIAKLEGVLYETYTNIQC